MYLYFQADEKQLKQLVLKCINASIPRGLGMLHYQNREYTEEDLNLKEFMNPLGNPEIALHIDYFDGRAVKLVIFKVPSTLFSLQNKTYKMREEIDLNYETWKQKYNTLEELLGECDIKVLYRREHFND